MISRPAPGVGEHNDEVLAGAKGPSQKSLGMLSPSPHRQAQGRLQSSPIKGEEDSITPTLGAMPFSGLRVLDFTWVGVGPITIKHLADFGADVIRIESVSRPDVLRNAAPFKDGVAGINRSQFSANYNTSKRGLGLNLASPEGRDLVRKIIREWKPDVIAESFTPRVMRGWGLAYSDVRRDAAGRDIFQHVPAGSDRAARELCWLWSACRVARRVLLRDRLAGQGPGRPLWRILGLHQPAQCGSGDSCRAGVSSGAPE